MTAGEALALTLGRDGNALPYMGRGWHGLENGFVWTGDSAELRLPKVTPGGCLLAIDHNTLSGHAGLPPLEITISIGAKRIDCYTALHRATWVVRLPQTVVTEATDPMVIRIDVPGAIRLPGNPDTRTLGLQVFAVRLIPELTPDLEHGAAPNGKLEFSTAGNAALMQRFVSLGHNRELGFAQRYCGAEPAADLLRWSGTPWRVLVDLLDSRFEGIGDDLTLRLEQDNPDYLVDNKRYRFHWHSRVREGEMTPEALLEREARYLRRTAEAFIETLTESSRIFVRVPLSGETMEHAGQILTALRRYGPATLLVVMEDAARFGHIIQMAPGLLSGWVAAYGHPLVPDVHTNQWLTLCQRAVEVVGGAPPARAKPLPAIRSPGVAKRDAADIVESGVERAKPVTGGEPLTLTFGRDGNAAPYMGTGWHGLENGFVWTDKSAELRLPKVVPGECLLAIDHNTGRGPTELPSLEITISLEAERLDHYVTRHPETRVVKLPESVVVAAADPMVIRIDVPGALPPRIARILERWGCKYSVYGFFPRSRRTLEVSNCRSARLHSRRPRTPP